MRSAGQDGGTVRTATLSRGPIDIDTRTSTRDAALRDRNVPIQSFRAGTGNRSGAGTCAPRSFAAAGQSRPSRNLESCSAVMHAAGPAVEVVTVVPATAGPPGAPRHVILFPGVGISWLSVRAPVAFGVSIVGGVRDPVLRNCWRCQRGGNNDDSSAEKCEFRHAHLLSRRKASADATRHHSRSRSSILILCRRLHWA